MIQVSHNNPETRQCLGRFALTPFISIHLHEVKKEDDNTCLESALKCNLNVSGSGFSWCSPVEDEPIQFKSGGCLWDFTGELSSKEFMEERPSLTEEGLHGALQLKLSASTLVMHEGKICKVVDVLELYGNPLQVSLFEHDVTEITNKKGEQVVQARKVKKKHHSTSIIVSVCLFFVVSVESQVIRTENCVQ